MDKPTLRDSVKHPEKMGPLGDAPEHRKRKPEDAAVDTPVREDAQIADRQQFTTSE